MKSKEFTIWLKGFIIACNDYAPTTKQWHIIKKELDKVNDNGVSIPVGGHGTPNGTITATPDYGFITYNSSTANTYPSGSSLSYTTDSKPHNENK
jgi:hypothetical protein